jgi:hypothetical protein
MPSQYEDLAWATCWYDVVYRIKLKTNEISTNHLQIYNSMAEIASAIFGDKKDSEKKEVIKVNDMNPDDAVNQLNSFFRMAGGL